MLERPFWDRLLCVMCFPHPEIHCVVGSPWRWRIERLICSQAWMRLFGCTCTFQGVCSIRISWAFTWGKGKEFYCYLHSMKNPLAGISVCLAPETLLLFWIRGSSGLTFLSSPLGGDSNQHRPQEELLLKRLNSKEIGFLCVCLLTGNTILPYIGFTMILWLDLILVLSEWMFYLPFS